MSKKILAWNINSATNRNISTPEFVGEEIKHQESEFIVLTEFCKTKCCRRASLSENRRRCVSEAAEVIWRKQNRVKEWP